MWDYENYSSWTSDISGGIRTNRAKHKWFSGSEKRKNDFFQIDLQIFNRYMFTKIEYQILKTILLELQIWVEVSELIKQNINGFPVGKRRQMDFFKFRTTHFGLLPFNRYMFTKLKYYFLKTILLELQIWAAVSELIKQNISDFPVVRNQKRFLQIP